MSFATPPNLPPDRPSGRQTYNVVTDLVTGPNLRKKDNVYQGVSILICLLLGVGIGALISDNWRVGAVAGGFFGLLVGLLGSGIFLMIFRAVRHRQERHD